MEKNIRRLGFAVIGLFILLAVYLGYINIFMAPSLASDPYNKRLNAMEEQIPRGAIYDRQGKPLAVSENGRRKYPLGSSAAHVVGFLSERYGRTGVERAYNAYLLGMSEEEQMKSLVDRMLGRKPIGNDVYLTLDAGLQSLASELLEGKKGAIAAVDPRNGDILALASSPTYDPGTLEDKAGHSDTGAVITNFDTLTQDSDSPLLNRAGQGAYPPGSIFKLVTAAGILKHNPGAVDQSIHCTGSIVVDGFKLPDIAAHGSVDLNKAIAVSCNSFFATAGLDLGAEGLIEMVQNFGITANPWKGKIQETALRPGTLTTAAEMTEAQLASTSIGQGELLVSPLHMALVAAAVANEGKIMQPHLMQAVKTPVNGEVIVEYQPEIWRNPISARAAKVLNDAMAGTVAWGTGTRAGIPGISVAGKTGSAQNPQGRAHAWFVGFAPAEEPRIAVAVVIENGGAGGTASAPLAREIMKRALSDIQ